MRILADNMPFIVLLQKNTQHVHHHTIANYNHENNITLKLVCGNNVTTCINLIFTCTYQHHIVGEGFCRFAVVVQSHLTNRVAL